MSAETLLFLSFLALLLFFYYSFSFSGVRIWKRKTNCWFFCGSRAHHGRYWCWTWVMQFSFFGLHYPHPYSLILDGNASFLCTKIYLSFRWKKAFSPKCMDDKLKEHMQKIRKKCLLWTWLDVDTHRMNLIIRKKKYKINCLTINGFFIKLNCTRVAFKS